MTSLARVVVVVVVTGATLVALVLCGCDDAGNVTGGAADEPRPAVPRPAPGEGGSVVGKVLFRGEPPPTPRAEGDCHPGRKADPGEPVAVGPGGGLKNVVVWLKEAAPFEGEPPSALPPAVLDQVNCQYVPRVVAVRAGQVLKVTSSDPTVHNVHALAEANDAVNVGMSGTDQPRELTFGAAEFIPVKCDVHPWMRATVAVFDHPHFAVTGEDGDFEIKDAPPGEYTLAAWHELLGTREQSVTVTKGKAAAAAAFGYGRGD